MEELENRIEQKANALIQKQENTASDLDANAYFDEVANAIGNVKGEIVEKAVSKVNDVKIIEKHSKRLAEISDKALAVETEKQELVVEKRKAENKEERQRIRNRLIELETERIRLEREQKQVLKEQKEDHKKRNNEIMWERYKDKLTKMKYTYVPNKFILKMLLFFDGVKSFFDGVGSVSTAIMKALKWLLIGGTIIGVMFAIPATREWLTSILG